VSFFEKVVHNGDATKVQVITSSKNPMSVIISFFSTLVMNFITARMAISLYPYATFQLETGLVSVDNSLMTADILQKYSDRGFTLLGRLLPDEADPRLKFGVAFRRVCDRYTWCLPLDYSPQSAKEDKRSCDRSGTTDASDATRGFLGSTTHILMQRRDDLSEHFGSNTWNMWVHHGQTPDDTPIVSYRLLFRELADITLRRSYTCSGLMTADLQEWLSNNRAEEASHLTHREWSKYRHLFSPLRYDYPEFDKPAPDDHVWHLYDREFHVKMMNEYDSWEVDRRKIEDQ